MEIGQCSPSRFQKCEFAHGLDLAVLLDFIPNPWYGVAGSM